MKIAHYSYDNVNNPRCGGGGAFRELMIHRILTARHEIVCYSGNYKGKRPRSDSNMSMHYLGFNINYLISRISFSILATIHSLFIKTDLIVIGYSVFSPVLTFLFRRNKCIIEFYHLVGKEPFRKYFLFGIFPWLAEQAVLKFGNNFITLTDGLSEYIEENYKKKMVCTAYTGFDESLLSDSKHDDTYILYFGRIDIHMKGIDILIDSFEKISALFPEYELRIAGRGSEKDIKWLSKRVEESKASANIKFYYNVGKEQKYHLFTHATFVCMPSRFEGWCISAVEAAACSKATIGTFIMGLKDSIKHEKTGILVRPEDSDALAEKMKLLLRNPDLRNELGKEGKKWAENFTWEKVSHLQEKFYENIYSLFQ
ncbi:MAG: glycosyltransferase family 4 protein [Chitinispirillia bacterium]|jgi:glycosyltransferase involved in cell wall biosynthesis